MMISDSDRNCFFFATSTGILSVVITLMASNTEAECLL